MILFTFRSVSFLSVLGLFGFIFFGPEASTSLNKDLADAEIKHNRLLIELESDKNESDLALSGLYRARVEFRDKEEGFLSKIQNLEAEISGFVPKLSGLEKEINLKSEQLSALEKSLVSASEPIKEVAKKRLPLDEKKKLIEEEISTLTQSLAKVKGETEQVESNFKTLEVRRNVASENFEEEKSRLMNGIKKPYHFYYSENKNILVSNRAPSGKGIFINNGYEEGFRENMEFITKNENASSTLPFRLKATLVQKKFSFLEFLNPLQIKDSSFASQGQNLRLTRSGESLTEGNANPEESDIE